MGVAQGGFWDPVVDALPVPWLVLNVPSFFFPCETVSKDPLIPVGLNLALLPSKTRGRLTCGADDHPYSLVEAAGSWLLALPCPVFDKSLAYVGNRRSAAGIRGWCGWVWVWVGAGIKVHHYQGCNANYHGTTPNFRFRTQKGTAHLW